MMPGGSGRRFVGNGADFEAFREMKPRSDASLKSPGQSEGERKLSEDCGSSGGRSLTAPHQGAEYRVLDV